MNGSIIKYSENVRDGKLPRRDWILLPTLSLFTICLLGALAELIGMWLYPDGKSTMSNCVNATDPSIGVHAIPNSVCTEESREAGRIEYRFNGCGHRAGMECGPKHPGSYRIVLVGTSIAMGALVPREESFAALLPAELSRHTGRNVELYNEAFTAEYPRVVAMRFNEIMAADPDMILWAFSPGDIWEASTVLPAMNKREREEEGYLRRALSLVKSSRASQLLQHVVYKSRNSFVRRYLLGSGSAGYLNAKLGPDWQQKLHEIDGYAAEIEARAKAAGVPVVAVMMPMRAQTAMISDGNWPAGYDPYNIDNEMRSIIENHGGTYLDILPEYRHIPNPDQDFFVTDGHPNGHGQLVISELLAGELTGGTVPELRSSSASQAALEQVK